MSYYEIPARILVQLNDGPNPTRLSEFVIGAKEGGRKVNEKGVVSHEVQITDVTYGLLVALHKRLGEGDPEEVDYIRGVLRAMIGENDK